jgi:hypothetical protein
MRTQWRFSRALLHTSAHITARQTPRYKVRLPFILVLRFCKHYLQVRNSSRRGTRRRSGTWIGRSSGSSERLQRSRRTCNPVCTAHNSHQTLTYSHRMAYRVRQGREFVTPPAGLSYTGQCVVTGPFYLSPGQCVVTGSCTKWITLARKATNRPQYSRKRLTCCSFCMLTTNSMQAVRRCSKLVAPSWIHTLRSRQWLT